MEFIKYQSLVNTYREKDLLDVKLNNNDNLQCIALEKLDGANFSFYCSRHGIKTGSRTQFVSGQFFNSFEVIEDTSSKIRKLYKLIEKSGLYPNLDYIVVYGELIGPKIQKRVKYCDKVDFIAFDILVIVNGAEYQLTVKESLDLFNQVSIKIPPVLFNGTLKECLNIPNDNKSNLLITDSDNIMEGLVIRGYYEDLINRFNQRVIFKNKNTKFSERVSKKKKSNMSNKTSEDLAELYSFDINDFINNNRLDSVISKLGGEDNLKPSDFGNIIKLFNADIIEDLINDNLIPSNYKKVDKFKTLAKNINTKAIKFLKMELLNKL